ncbi:MAG: pyridoxal-dependent decarboxylase, partial [Cyclobacteriaceae bacterium]|nr:pyridoxal-dependent decarboxylase [Cyclobacteriaceae bacterium]
MRETILALENASKSLEPDSGERENLRNKIVHYTEDFLTNIGTRKAFEADKNKGRKIMDIAPGKDLFSVEEVIELLKETLDKEGINPASGGHLGYIPGGGIYASSLADYWADITNRYAAVFFANPSAVRVENRLIQWMSEMVGYPSTAHGNLTSGGSIANLTGIVTARESKGIKAAKVQQSAIYLTRQAHLSIVKALNITGLQE